MRDSLYTRYLGVLGLLSKCSVQVDEETRESIEEAFRDACAHHGLMWRRALNRIEIEPTAEHAEEIETTL